MRLVTDDSFAALIRAYRQSTKWILPPPQGYSDGTKELWGHELDCVARPDMLGAKTVQEMRPALVQGYLDGISHLPGKQKAARAVLVQLERWAIVRDLLPRQIMLGTSADGELGGHLPWTDTEVELAERCARSDLARVITLAANTGQRGSDLVRMGPTDLETYQGINGINVTQKKTGRQVWVPITSPLAAAMATWERRPGPFLMHLDGRPWTRKQLSNAWGEHFDSNKDLAPLHERGRLVMHGLRGTACVRLKRAGAGVLQIADMVGMSVPMVERYCRFSIQRENAIAAVYHLERTLSERDKISTGQKQC